MGHPSPIQRCVQFHCTTKKQNYFDFSQANREVGPPYIRVDPPADYNLGAIVKNR